MPKFKSLGDRMKFYEKFFGANLIYAMPMVPLIIRLDGKAFHTFTRGLPRPFSAELIELMNETTKHLVEITGACIGYTQSDEITLILHQSDYDSQIFFDGKIDKINSILASRCSLFFNKALPKFLPQKVESNPVFDCRCFSVPNEVEAVNAIVWREQDATRNSIQMLGQAHFSHKRLQNKNQNEIQEMLWSEKGINWNDLEPGLKRGRYFQRKEVERPFNAEEINQLPPMHEARNNPTLKVLRKEIILLDLPIITKVTNIQDVFFRGATPNWYFLSTPKQAEDI